VYEKCYISERGKKGNRQFENRLLRRTLGSEKVEVTGDWRGLARIRNSRTLLHTRYY
jgi:hypothetical protein